MRRVFVVAGLMLAALSSQAAVINQTCQSFNYSVAGHSTRMLASTYGTSNCSITESGSIGYYQISGPGPNAGVGGSGDITAYYESLTTQATNGFVLDIVAGGSATFTSFYTGSLPQVGGMSTQSYSWDSFQVDQLYQYSLYAGEVNGLSANFFESGTLPNSSLRNTLFSGFLRPGETYTITGGAPGMLGALNGTSSGEWGGRIAFLTATAVPEPGTLALLSAGLGLFGAIRRRRAR